MMGICCFEMVFTAVKKAGDGRIMDLNSSTVLTMVLLQYTLPDV